MKGRVDYLLRPNSTSCTISPPIIQVVLVHHRGFIVMFMTEVNIGLRTAIFSYNHGELNISHPRFPQESIPGGVQRENQHQNHPYYSCPCISPHRHRSMSQHPHHNIPPNIYPIIPPHPIFLIQCFTSTPIYLPYVVTRYPHIPSLVYLHRSSRRLPSSVLPPHYSKGMNEHRSKRSNRRSNEQKKKRIDVMSIREG